MKKIVLMFLILSVVMTLFVACNNNDLEKITGQTTGDTDNGDGTIQTVYYTVTFNTDGGTEIASQIVEKGGKVVKPIDPVKITVGNTVYTFIGWYVGETEYDFETVVNSDLTIKARWKADNYSESAPI